MLNTSTYSRHMYNVTPDISLMTGSSVSFMCRLQYVRYHLQISSKLTGGDKFVYVAVFQSTQAEYVARQMPREEIVFVVAVWGDRCRSL